MNKNVGVPSCANPDILTTDLRDDWGFQGYITSDCYVNAFMMKLLNTILDKYWTGGAVSNVQNNHHYTNSTGATVQAVFAAGMDINCGGYTQKNTASAVSSGAAQLRYCFVSYSFPSSNVTTTNCSYT